MNLTRRSLLTNAGGLASLSVLANPAMAAILRQRPELILHNGHILTMDGRQPQAEAMAIAGERILAVGSDVDILDFAGAGTKKVDLGGKTVVPGFIDGHCHPAYSGRRHLRFIDCDLRSIAAIQDAVRERAAKTPPGEWVAGFKYDDTKTAEKRFITREDLDAAAPDHPGVHRAPRRAHGLREFPRPREGRHHREVAGPRGRQVRPRPGYREAHRAPARARGGDLREHDSGFRHDQPRRGPGRDQADHADVREGRRHLLDRRLRLAGRPARLPGRARGRRALLAHLLHDRVHAPRPHDRLRRAHRLR